jgi:hypothetical protein
MSKAQKNTIPTKYNHMNHIPVLNQGICCHRLDWFLDYFTAGSKLLKFTSTEGDSELLTNYQPVRILKDAFVVYQKHLLQILFFFIVAPCMLWLLLHRACCYDYCCTVHVVMIIVAPCMLLRLLLHRACCYDYCCTVHVVMIISFIPTHAHFLHTLKTPIDINT